MHLKSITVKGFKSFPERTRLEFGPGVSVIVGPNGSGKSNITDAVLWALGEQSPLAVRGQTMQDVIFAGSEGVKGRSSCEVEVVIDNADGQLRSDFSEISISRHLDRSGEGVYRLNGARCRLVDVIEVLSDTGLGKEMHSVISQGRVEAIIHSKPFDRTALIEEAAGLSKHRKRRRRAQLKLGRTQDNLDRALDVEREARSRLRPLKRQAEAAELHSRLERQSLELRSRLTGDSLAAIQEELSEAERASGEARRERDRLEQEQTEVARNREQTERGLAEHGRDRERLTSLLFSTRSAGERIEIRLESVRAVQRTIEARLQRSVKALEGADGADRADEPEAARLPRLEAELAKLDRERDAGVADELETIERQRREADERATELAELCETKAVELAQAESAADDARERRRLAGDGADAATRKRAALEVELEALVQRQRLLAGDEGPSLSQEITVDDGYEAALAGALGSRLTAPIVESLEQGAELMERAAADGAIALVGRSGPENHVSTPPTPAAERLLAHVSCDPALRGLLERLLGDAWVLDRIEDVEQGFEGIAVTPAGIVYQGGVGELRRLPAAGTERALAERSRRDQLEAELGRATLDLEQARSDADRASAVLRESEEARDRLEAELRNARREREDALEGARRAQWLIERRRDLGADPQDAQRAHLVAEIAAERRLAAGLAVERTERVARRRRLEAASERDRGLLPAAEGLTAALESALAAVAERRAALERELSVDEAVGEQAAAELRRLAQAEYDLQARLRQASELLTQEEVRVAHVRDRHAALVAELEEISGRLGRESEPGERLPSEERMEAESRLERLERRRERLGPVNPLAESEYEQALDHVEELEQQRKDLEQALAELAGLIRETDRRIRESFEQTFELAARNFEDVIQHLFPGGRGHLRLVKQPRPQPVLGGAEPEERAEAESAEEQVAQPATDPAADLSADGNFSDSHTPGIEIEVTPAGKSTKRLSLLSGGEKSLVALGFLFSVFLARPCPFYILDEVEAALDDRNIDRFLALVRGYSDRSQFIVITHQRRTMDAADVLYGVSMGGDGISRIVSRRLEAGPDRGESISRAA